MLFKLRESQTLRFVFSGENLDLLAETGVLIDEFLIRVLLVGELQTEGGEVTFELLILLDEQVDLLTHLNHLFFEQSFLAEELVDLGNFGGSLDGFGVKFGDFLHQFFVLSSEEVELVFEVSDSAFGGGESLDIEG